MRFFTSTIFLSSGCVCMCVYIEASLPFSRFAAYSHAFIYIWYYYGPIAMRKKTKEHLQHHHLSFDFFSLSLSFSDLSIQISRSLRADFMVLLWKKSSSVLRRRRRCRRWRLNQNGKERSKNLVIIKHSADSSTSNKNKRTEREKKQTSSAYLKLISVFSSSSSNNRIITSYSAIVSFIRSESSLSVK